MPEHDTLAAREMAHELLEGVIQLKAMNKALMAQLQAKNEKTNVPDPDAADDEQLPDDPDGRDRKAE